MGVPKRGRNRWGYKSDRMGGRPQGFHYIKDPGRLAEMADDELVLAAQGRIQRAPKRLSFTVPLPPRALSPNWERSQDKRAKMAVVKNYRYAVEMLAREAIAKQHWMRLENRPCLLHLTFGTKPGDPRERIGDDAYWLYRPADWMNGISAFKAGADGMTDAGVWTDDAYRWVRSGVIHIDNKMEPGIHIVVEECLDA